LADPEIGRPQEEERAAVRAQILRKD